MSNVDLNPFNALSEASTHSASASPIVCPEHRAQEEASLECSGVELEQPNQSSQPDQSIPIERVKVYKIQAWLADENQRYTMLVDSGSEINVMPRKTCEKLGLALKGVTEGAEVTAFNGSTSKILGTIAISLKVGNETREQTFYVLNGATKLILGTPAIQQFNMKIDGSTDSVEMENGDRILCHAVEVPKNE